MVLIIEISHYNTAPLFSGSVLTEYKNTNNKKHIKEHVVKHKRPCQINPTTTILARLTYLIF